MVGHACPDRRCRVRRSAILICAAVAVGAAVAFAWYAPTVLVAAPLWIMALCVITGWRAAPDAEGASSDGCADPAPRPDPFTVVPGGLSHPADRRRVAG